MGWTDSSFACDDCGDSKTYRNSMNPNNQPEPT